MTFICLVIGCAIIAYGIASLFDLVPIVGKEDLDREARMPITTRERPIMISEIVDVKIPGGEHHENKTTLEEVTEPYISNFVCYDVPLSDDIQRYITLQCLEKFGTLELYGHNLPKLVMNIIRWESGFDSTNDNGKCCGLMSVTHNLSDAIKEEENITDLIQPEQNIRAGIRILKNQYDNMDKLLSAHGLNGVKISNYLYICIILDGYHNGGHNYELDGDYIANIIDTYLQTNERS